MEPGQHPEENSELENRVTGPKEQLRAAIQSGDGQMVFEKIRELNDQLIPETNQRSRGGVAPQLNPRAQVSDQFRRDIENFLSNVRDRQSGYLKIYLGDGALSRVEITYDKTMGLEMWATNNSSDEVLKIWNELD